MVDLAVTILRNAYQNITPGTPLEKMLYALVREQVRVSGTYI